MVRTTADMLDPVPCQFLLELGLAVPRRILPAVIRQHLLGHPVRSNATPEHLQQIIGRLAAEYFQGRDVPGMIVDEPDQVGVPARAQPFGRPDSFPAKLEGEDIALPHLVGRGALEKARLRRVGRRLFLPRRDELFAVQGLSHRFRARRQVEYPPQGLRDALDTKGRMFALERRYLGADQRPRRRRARDRWPVDATGPVPFRVQSRFPLLTVLLHPFEDRPVTHPNFSGHDRRWHPFFQVQLHRPALDGVGLRPRVLVAVALDLGDGPGCRLAPRAAPSSPPRRARPVLLPRSSLPLNALLHGNTPEDLQSIFIQKCYPISTSFVGQDLVVSALEKNKKRRERQKASAGAEAKP